MDNLNIEIFDNGVVGVKGSGTKYDDFYTWQRSLLSSEDIKISWPWHYFILNNSEEYKQLFSKYRNNITFKKKDYTY